MMSETYFWTAVQQYCCFGERGNVCKRQALIPSSQFLSPPKRSRFHVNEIFLTDKKGTENANASWKGCLPGGWMWTEILRGMQLVKCQFLFHIVVVLRDVEVNRGKGDWFFSQVTLFWQSTQPVPQRHLPGGRGQWHLCQVRRPAGAAPEKETKPSARRDLLTRMLLHVGCTSLPLLPVLAYCTVWPAEPF